MSNNQGGIGFLGMLTIVFIALKLTDNIDWSWWAVFAPIWVPSVILIVVLLVLVVKS